MLGVSKETENKLRSASMGRARREGGSSVGDISMHAVDSRMETTAADIVVDKTRAKFLLMALIYSSNNRFGGSFGAIVPEPALVGIPSPR